MAELEARRTRAAELLDEARKVEQAGGDAVALRAQAAPLLARFVSPYRDGGAPPAADAPFVVRLKAPLEGETVVEDGVQGRVVFPNKDLDDLVLLRSDGTPTYNLAVVVDDHDMGVTHVIRGDDHLVNAGRQTQIYQALGWTTPQFAHVPLIHGPGAVHR
jgi:glutamyl-tRNA synthetase